jgi:hypothetical protein
MNDLEDQLSKLRGYINSLTDDRETHKLKLRAWALLGITFALTVFACL